MTKVFFVRHARPNYDNHDDLLRELSTQGMKDRRLVTEFLSDKDIDIIFSSPYRRTVDTLKPFAEQCGLDIEMIEDFRERKVDASWIEDFTEFARKQWNDFNYKLSGGECLKEVQDRNVSALYEILKKHPGKNIVIGSHGTALCTLINYFERSFGYDDFERVKGIMPWIVEFDFDDNAVCVGICEHSVK